METIAVYWEPVIKTYGIVERTGLRMLSATLAAKGDSQAERSLDRLVQGRGELVLILAGTVRDGHRRVHLVVSGAVENQGGTAPTQAGSAKKVGTLTETAVDLIFLQGPHYGDRYGILETAFRALLSAGVSPLAASCCGSCIYLVLPPGMTPPARGALSEVFVVPGFEESKKGR